jgi:hypothetical protein
VFSHHFLFRKERDAEWDVRSTIPHFERWISGPGRLPASPVKKLGAE